MNGSVVMQKWQSLKGFLWVSQTYFVSFKHVLSVSRGFCVPFEVFCAVPEISPWTQILLQFHFSSAGLTLLQRYWVLLGILYIENGSTRLAKSIPIMAWVCFVVILQFDISLFDLALPLCQWVLLEILYIVITSTELAKVPCLSFHCKILWSGCDSLHLGSWLYLDYWVLRWFGWTCCQ